MFGKLKDKVEDHVRGVQEKRERAFEEEMQPKTLQELFSETTGGDEISRNYNVRKGTIEYKAISDRKKDDLTISSHQTLTKKARAMKYIAWFFKPFSFYGSFYSMRTEISNSFTLDEKSFAVLFISLSIAFLIELLLHFEASSLFNQREMTKTRFVGTGFFILLISINIYMHYNTTLIMRDKYAKAHEANIVEEIKSPEAMLIKSKIAKIEKEIAIEEKTLLSKRGAMSEQLKMLQQQRKTYMTSKEYLLSKHESKRARARKAIADVDAQIRSLGVNTSRLDSLNAKLIAEKKELARISNNKLEEIASKGDRAMYVAIILLLVVELGSRLDLYFYFITRFNLAEEVLAMTRKAFNGMSILEQVQDIFMQLEDRLSVVANQQQQLATTLITGQENIGNYQMLGMADTQQRQHRNMQIVLGKLDEKYENFGTAYSYDPNLKTESKSQDLLNMEMQKLNTIAKNEGVDVIILFDSSIKGAKLEGKIISIQSDLIFQAKVEQLLHEIAHIRAGTPTHNKEFKREAENLGVKMPTTKNSIIGKIRAYDIYMGIILTRINNQVIFSLSDEERAEMIRLGIIDDQNRLLTPSIVAFEKMTDE